MSARLAGSAIYNKLITSAGTALWSNRVYKDQAPESAIIGNQPFLVFNYVAGGPLNVSPTRIEDLRFDVKCISPTVSNAETGADYIDSAFHNQTLTVSGFTNWATTVIGEISMVDNTEGRQDWIKGKQIRLRLSST